MENALNNQRTRIKNQWATNGNLNKTLFCNDFLSMFVDSILLNKSLARINKKNDFYLSKWLKVLKYLLR